MEQAVLIGVVEYFGIAFASAIVLILISKFILPIMIRKPVDYYHATELEEDIKLVDKINKNASEKYSLQDLDIMTEPKELPLTREDFNQIEQMMEDVYDEMETDIENELVRAHALEQISKTTEKSLMKRRKLELISLAEDIEISVPDKVTKAELVQLIKNKKD